MYTWTLHITFCASHSCRQQTTHLYILNSLYKLFRSVLTFARLQCYWCLYNLQGEHTHQELAEELLKLDPVAQERRVKVIHLAACLVCSRIGLVTVLKLWAVLLQAQTCWGGRSTCCQLAGDIRNPNVSSRICQAFDTVGFRTLSWDW